MNGLARVDSGCDPVGIGTLSVVIDPFSWLAAGNSLREVFAEADLLFVFVAPIRAVHLAAVLAALVFMFLPAANNYFRSASSPAGTLGSPTVAPTKENPS
jgi:hypothetical protein